MLLHRLAHRPWHAIAGGRLERRHVWRRRGGWRREQVLENPLAAQHRRSAGAIRGQRQDAPLPQQAAARLFLQLDTTEVAAVDMRNAVVLRQPLVHERVTGRQQIEHAAVVAQDAVDEQLRLAAKGLSQVLVETWKVSRIRFLQLDVPKIQPLLGEIRDQRFGSGVGQHAPHLLVEHARRAELTATRQVEQLVVRDAGPEKERQARGELEIGDPVDLSVGHTGRVSFDAEQKLRAHQHAFDGALDTALEATLDTPPLVERQEPLEVLFGHRAPIGATCHRRQDLPRARLLVGRRGAGAGSAAEDVTAAWCVARAIRAIGSADDQAGDGRLTAARPSRPDDPPGDRSTLGQKGHSHVTGTGPERHAHLHVGVGVEGEDPAGQPLRWVLADGEQTYPLAVDADLDVVRLTRGTREHDRDEVLAVERQMAPHAGPAACAERQALDVPVLHQVAVDPVGVDDRQHRRIAHGEPTDLAGGTEIPFHQRRRHEQQIGEIVESAGGVVGRQHHLDVHHLG